MKNWRYETEMTHQMGFAEQGLAFKPCPAAHLEEKRARLRLVRSRGVGPITYRKLLAEHGTAIAALAALPDRAAQAGLKGYTPACNRQISAEIATARRIKARLLSIGDRDYPAALAQVENAPPILWALGDRELLSRTAVALVGTRNASSLGARMARHLAEGLGAAGFVTVSGLARGIDAVVHDASLSNGTIAVQAGGVDTVYPAENAALARAIADQGLRLSEAPMGYIPQARDFPRRNRIISGLVRAVVVVEAAARSGSMITAKEALDQGRDVLAIPGHPLDGRSEGCNQLLQDGAQMVCKVEDILAVLTDKPNTPVVAEQPSLFPDDASNTHLSLSQVETKILEKLRNTPQSEADLLRALNVETASAGATLSLMEMRGQIVRMPGGAIARA